MITRIYTTKEACAELFLNEMFDRIPLDLLEGPCGTYDNWEFRSIVDSGEFDPEDPMAGDGYDYDSLSEPDEKDHVYAVTDPPMWGTIFRPSDEFARRRIEVDPQAVAALGFTLVYDAEGHFYALGINGAGYDFIEAHWVPLYDHFGIHWHDEEGGEE